MSARGIIESEVWRSEQLEAAERESDPANPAVGESWVRVDINPSVDGAQALAELRIQGPTGVLQVPLIDIQDQPSLGPDVYVGPRCFLGSYVDNGLSGVGEIAFVPVTDQGGALGSPRVVTPAGVEFEAHDAVELSAIPDSAIHRWKFDDVGSGIVDAIGSAHFSTNNGIASVSSADYQGGSAGIGDGSKDYAQDGTLSSFTSSLDTDFAISWTVDDYSVSSATNTMVWGVVDSVGQILQCNVSGNNPGDIFIVVKDENGNSHTQGTDTGHIGDGNQHRVLINKVANSDANAPNSAVEIYVADKGDTSYTDVATSTDVDEGLVSFQGFDREFTTWARNSDRTIDSHTNCVLDDMIIYSDSLSSSERDKDLSAQPAFG